MNKISFLTIVFFLNILSVMAQFQPTGALTIFSEDGDKFFLILNGEPQNNIAQSNIRVEDLPQPYYTAKIVFENKSYPEILKKNLMVADLDGNFLDVTYKIKHDKSDMPKMASIPYSSIPAQQGFVAPSNVYVAHFGAPLTPAAAVTTTTTTTTTTTNNNVNGANINVNAMGINMNVNISDPFLNGTVQTTTTESTTVSGNNPPPRPVNRGCANSLAMSSSNFTSALSTLNSQSFEESKLSTAKQIAGANCLSAVQISDICKLFNFEDSKLDFAKFAYNRCTEPGNYFIVNNVFNFSGSVDDLNEYIQSRN
jgi:hypothetical protein